MEWYFGEQGKARWWNKVDADWWAHEGASVELVRPRPRHQKSIALNKKALSTSIRNTI
jgi:hypothetical protein